MRLGFGFGCVVHGTFSFASFEVEKLGNRQ